MYKFKGKLEFNEHTAMVKEFTFAVFKGSEMLWTWQV